MDPAETTTEDELREALQILRLKLRAGKGLIRDLTLSVGTVERLLDRLEHDSRVNAQPKEAQREHEDTRRRTAA